MMSDHNTENQGTLNIMELFEEYVKLQDSTDIVAKLQYLIRRKQAIAGSMGADSAIFSIRVLREAVETIESLMKAQEPRVLTLEDLWALKFNDTVILEQKFPSLLIPAIVRDSIKHDDALEVLQVVTASTNGTANADYEYYGKTWRCWTSSPTDEQREKVKWE